MKLSPDHYDSTIDTFDDDLRGLAQSTHQQVGALLESGKRNVAQLREEAQNPSSPGSITQLALISIRDGWEAAASEVSPALKAVLDLKDVPSSLSYSLAALNELDDPNPEKLETLLTLCRRLDCFLRINAFNDSYDLPELRALQPWTRLGVGVLGGILESNGVTHRRPTLLERPSDEFISYDRNFRNEELVPLEGVRSIVAERLKTTDRFVVDVTQSEIWRNGGICRIGVMSLVNPHMWR